MKFLLNTKKSPKTMKLVTNWALYNISNQNIRVELFKYIISEMQIIFIIIHIYYSHIEKNALLYGFNAFLKKLSWFANNSPLLIDIDIHSNDDAEIDIDSVSFLNATYTTWICFIIANAFVYLIMILGGLLYVKDTVFLEYKASVYRYLGWCRSWYYSVLFFIVHQLALFQLESILDNHNNDYIFTNIEILNLVLSIILCVSNFIVSLIFCMFFVIGLEEDYNYYNNHIQVLLTIVFKFGISFIQFIDHQLIQKLIFNSLIVCFIACRIWKYLQISCYKIHYYSIIICIFLGIEICQSINFIINMIIPEMNIYYLVILSLCSPLISKFLYCLLIYRYRKVIYISNPKNEAEIMSKYHTLKEYIAKGYQSDYTRRKIYEYELIIEGEMIDHQYTCMNCTYVNELQSYIEDHSTRRAYFNKLKLHYLEMILLRGIEKHPKSFGLMKELVMLYHNKKKNIIRGMLYLQKFSALCNTIDKLILLEYLKIKIKKLHDSINQIDSGLDLEGLIRCEDFHNGFMEILKNQAYNINALWKILQGSSIPIISILDQAEIINNEFFHIEKLWKKYELSSMKYYFKPLYIYSNFLILLNNQEVLGEEYLDKYNKLKLEGKDHENEKILTCHNLFSEKNVIINVSACKEKLGEIISCTPNVNDMLEYDSSKLLKKNISTIIPNIYQSVHDILMENYLKTGKNSVLNHNELRYARDINNYLVPFYIHIQLMMSYDLKLTFMTLLRPFHSIDQAMILSSDGRICAITKGLITILNLPSNHENKKINIFDICPDVMSIITDIRRRFKRKSLNKIKTRTYNNLDQITIINPENESNIMNLEPQILTFTKYSYEKSQIKKNFMRFEVDIKIASKYLNETYFVLTIKQATGINYEKQYIVDSIINAEKDDCSNECDFKTERERDYDLSEGNITRTLDDLNPLPASRVKLPSDTKRWPSMQEKNIESKMLDQELFMLPFSSVRMRLLESDNKIGISFRDNSHNLDGLETSKQIPLITKSPRYSPRFERYDLDNKEEKKILVLDSMEIKLYKNKNNNGFSKPIMEDILNDSSSFIGRRSSKKRFMKKIYAAFDIPYDPISLRIRLHTFLLLLMGCLMVSIMIQYKLTNRIIRIEQDITVINACNNRLTNYIGLNKRAVIAYSVYNGLISRKRWIQYGTADYFNSLILLLNDTLVNIISNNTLIRTSLPDILDEFQIEFYNTKIELYEYYANGTRTGAYSTLNTFNAIEQTYSIVQRLLLEVISNKIRQDFFEGLFFIVRNGLNNFLIALKESPDILINDMDSVASEGILVSMLVIIGFSALNIVVLGISITGLIMTYKENIKLLENLIKISKGEIDKEIEKSKEFMMLISMGNIRESKKLIENQKAKIPSIISISKPSNRNTSYLSKKFSYKLIFWKYSVIMTILLGISILIFGNYFRIFSDFKNRHELLSKRLISANFMFYQQHLAHAGLYEYIAENRTTNILNRPIKGVLNELIVNVSKFSDFLSIFQTSNGEFDSNYEYVFQGDLCSIFLTTQSTASAQQIKICKSFAGGVMTQGLLALNTYLYQVLYNGYINYDLSNKTKQAQIEIMLNDMFKNYEFLFFFGNVPAYNQLNNLILQELYDLGAKYQIDLKNSAMITSFCLILSLIIIWYPLQKKVRNENNKVKKVMRVYPKTFLLGNLMLKKFIFKSSNGMLGTSDDFYNSLQEDSVFSQEKKEVK